MTCYRACQKYCFQDQGSFLYYLSKPVFKALSQEVFVLKHLFWRSFSAVLFFNSIFVFPLFSLSGQYQKSTQKKLFQFRFCTSSCGLWGWYFQDAEQRKSDPSMWDHFLILDHVSPLEFFKSKITERLDEQYQWANHRMGSSYWASIWVMRAIWRQLEIQKGTIVSIHAVRSYFPNCITYQYFDFPSIVSQWISFYTFLCAGCSRQSMAQRGSRLRGLFPPKYGPKRHSGVSNWIGSKKKVLRSLGSNTILVLLSEYIFIRLTRFRYYCAFSLLHRVTPFWYYCHNSCL